MNGSPRTIRQGRIRKSENWISIPPLAFLILTLMFISNTDTVLSETPPVTIAAEIKSNIFSYELENRTDKAVMGIRIPQHGTYFYTMPEGWEKQIDGQTLHLWTDKLSRSVRAGGKGQFSMRVSSYGAVLGTGSVIVELDGGQTLTVPDVWVPVREPMGYVRLVAAGILGIMLVHALVSWLHTKRSSRTP